MNPKQSVIIFTPVWPTKNEIPIINQLVEIKKQGVHIKKIIAFGTNVSNQEEMPKEILNQKLDNIEVIYLTLPPLGRFKNKVINKLYVNLIAMKPVFRTLFKSPRLLYSCLFNNNFGEFTKAFKIVHVIQPLLNDKLHADVIHCQYAPTGIWGCILTDLNILNGKVITSFRGYGINKLPQMKPSGYYSFLIKNGYKFTANSYFTLKNALKVGFKKNDIQVIRSGLNISKYNFIERYWDSTRTLELLSVAALKTVKGLKYSILSINILKMKYPNLKISYKIAGEGYLKDELESIILANELQNEVKLVGFIEHNELKLIYKRTHILIHPSITTSDGNQEAQGLVIQEAQASGIPVVATNSGGIPEGFVDKETGFIVEEKNSQEIAEKISLFIQSPKLISTFGRKGRLFVEENFCILKETQKLIELYK